MIGNLTNEEIDRILKNNFLGRLGCTDGRDTYVVPINYIYSDGVIIAHSVSGLKIRMMRQIPRVCFLVDEIKSFREWNSVIIRGNYEELVDETEKYAAIKLFVERIMHLKVSETAIPPELTENRLHPRSPGAIHPIIYRIQITEKSGRFERSA